MHHLKLALDLHIFRGADLRRTLAAHTLLLSLLPLEGLLGDGDHSQRRYVLL